MNQPLPRNIAVFIDGTWNTAKTKTPTNVKKLYDATKKIKANGREQRTLYISGVGTRPEVDADALSEADYRFSLGKHVRFDISTLYLSSYERKIISGATGMGTKARITEAYEFVCSLYRKKSKDKVFLFGFSRGAFAARSLAGFLGKVGLLLADKLERVPEAYKLYEDGTESSNAELQDFLYELTGVKVLTPENEYYLPTHFLGVWDTVAALGLPSRLQWLTAPFTEYHQVECPPSVMIARHALALHELRDQFEPLLWKEGSHRNLMQVWFPGAHADVGGGYKIGDDGNSDVALRWMALEAERAGLTIDRQATWWTKWSERNPIHHQLRDWFLLNFPSPRSWLLDTDLDVCRSHYFHESAANHIKESANSSYAFKLLHVKAALKTVDELAFRRLVYFRLTNKEVVHDS